MDIHLAVLELVKCGHTDKRGEALPLLIQNLFVLKWKLVFKKVAD
jgi:hypothetical protein